MGDPIDDLANSAILSQSCLGGINLRVRYVFLPLPPAFADNQIVPWTVAIPTMASTAWPGAGRKALYPRTVQHVRQRAQFSKKPGSLIEKFFQSSV